MKNSRRYAVFGFIIVVVFAASVGFWRSEIKHKLFMWGIVDRVQFSVRAFRIAPYADEIISLADIPEHADFHTKIDSVRLFILGNSIRGADKEIYGPNGGQVLLAKMLIAHAEDKSQKLPRVECSYRSGLMAAVLERMGYETRIVNVFNTTDLSPKVPQSSHTFLDVKNPSSGVWESQDPDYDLYWKSINTGSRIAVSDFGEDIDQIEPCRPNACGWDIIAKGVPRNLIRYFQIFSLFDETKNRRYSLYTSRADLTAIHGNSGRHGKFCDVYFYSCRSGFFPAR